MIKPLVVKVGGSLAESGRLTRVLEVIARAEVPVVLVPGGGPFADAVRTIQPLLGLNDALCHQLALLAMHQMGLVIAAHGSRYTTAESISDITRELANGNIPVWLPSSLQRDDTTLPADWTVTSDALAARLAERLGNASVALIKSCLIPAGTTLVSATQQGLVDPVFATVVARARLTSTLFGAGDNDQLAESLRAKGWKSGVIVKSDGGA
jgi:5-(aminomethyl)-3-furanmethanol phosphate kinase